MVLTSTFSASVILLGCGLRRGGAAGSGSAAYLVVGRIGGRICLGIAFKLPTECEWRGANFSCRELNLHVRILLSPVATGVLGCVKSTVSVKRQDGPFGPRRKK